MRLTRHLRVRLLRYAAGSVVAFAVSEVSFVVLFAPHLLGAKGASIVASLIGVVPGYFLNRNWAWGRRGRSHPWREILPYWMTVLVSTALAAVTIGAVNHAATAAELGRDVRTVINAVTYCAVYGTLFVAKFVVFNRWLFPDSRRPAPPEPDHTAPADTAGPVDPASPARRDLARRVTAR